ncbi:MAG: NUDIX domain-containing protein [Bacteroidetes bacterium]|nr:NUDIX domain-containing protein [Bacteroidota bacterium]
MYKVFVNDCPIILTDDKKISTKYKRLIFENVDVLGIVKQMLNLELAGICMVCSDLELCWNVFKNNFKIQKAAGGKVFNSKKEILFIYRFNKWDLPKGKLEKGESIEQCAIREVEEECGISNLMIENELETTYHIFERKEKTIFKITYWFLMTTNYIGTLTPQIAEGIEEVVFKNQQSTEQALDNSYENIKLLF